MLFGSVEFLLFFLPLFLTLYGLTPKKFKNLTLLSGSLIFYAAGEIRFLIPLCLSLVVNYFVGLHLSRGRVGKKLKRNIKIEKKRKFLYPAAVVVNLGILVAFKFFVPQGLPLGLSFYTFQIISYLTDLYWEEELRETSFVRMAAYVVMFPKLVSGPIATYGELREQLNERSFTVQGLQEGLKLFTAGLAGKVLLADNLGLLWREVQVIGFESISIPMAWLGAIAFSMNIYFDFWGYSLMARGTGRMLGFELPQNFKNPYMATTVREFYRRWHISLGKWFTKYVYIPLGGSRKGEWRTIVNLLVVWVLTSVWHGNTLNFLVWGLLLWLLIVLERQAGKLGIIGVVEKIPGKMFSHIYIWLLIPITWMCFAITDLGQLKIYLGRMFGLIVGENVNLRDWYGALADFGGLLAVGAFCCTAAAEKVFRKFKDGILGTIILVLLFWFCVWRIQVAGENPFMYVRF